ncbi:MAG: RNA polymerase sigma factor [Thermoguttaceae bacterium]
MNAQFDTVLRFENPEELSDSELMVACQREENARCFDEIVRRFRPCLAIHLRKRLSLDSDQLEDVLQATFCRVWTRRLQYDATRPFRPWIYRIANSQAVDLLRSTSRHSGGVSLDAPRGASEDAPALVNELESDCGDPAYMIEERDYAKAVRHVARSLPARYRDVIEMVFYQGMTCQSVAKTLNLAAATVSRRVCRALELMRASLLSGRLDSAC